MERWRYWQQKREQGEEEESGEGAVEEEGARRRVAGRRLRDGTATRASHDAGGWAGKALMFEL